MGPNLRRRDLLKGAGAAAALGPACATQPTRDWQPIEHIVVLMMENRSFDHVLGSLTLLEGRDDVDGLLASHANPGPSGPIPVHPATSWCVGDPPHSWTSSRVQFAGGTNQGFVQAYVDRHGADDAAIPMGFYTRRELPISYALADAYTICDQWFCSLLTSTWPNRLYSLGGQSEGMPHNDFPGGGFTYNMRTIFDQLDEAGVSWGSYYSAAPFLWTFERFRNRDELRLIEEFFEDCRDGTLPAVSWIDPAWAVNDDHPPAHPQMGQLLIASIHAALAASPAWDRTLLLITYDENGGFYDHVPPPKAVDERASEGFDQLGFRVPTFAIGPWVRRGHTSKLLYDHTSALTLIQDRFGLGPLTERNAAANGLEDVLDWSRLFLGQPAEPTTLPVLEFSEEQILTQCQGGPGSTGQPELEALLDATAAPARIDRRAAQESLARFFLEEGERLGACKLLR
jgi:phospholipase C